MKTFGGNKDYTGMRTLKTFAILRDIRRDNKSIEQDYNNV